MNGGTYVSTLFARAEPSRRCAQAKPQRVAYLISCIAGGLSKSQTILVYKLLRDSMIQHHLLSREDLANRASEFRLNAPIL
jgi:hypothetical protein